MSKNEKKFIVEPGTKLSLRDFDSAAHGKFESRKEARPEMEKSLEKLDRLQYVMYAEGRHSLLIVLQGMDTAGKDGVIRHVLAGMNPSACRVARFNVPSPRELDHDFLWRVHPHVPGRGEVAIFNRSHYEDLLVPWVHEQISKEMWQHRHDRVNDFEKLLVEQNGTTILKFFLHISKEKQLDRFKRRLEDPARQWKISESDYAEREVWGNYQRAYEHILSKTSSKHAPWYVIPSDYKWYRDLVISEILVETFKSLGMRCPEPKVDLDEIRRKYHDAASDNA